MFSVLLTLLSQWEKQMSKVKNKKKNEYKVPSDVYVNDAFIVKYDGKECLLVIEQDQDPTDPREWDNLGTMVCAHSRYNLGDEQIDPHDFLDTLAGEYERPLDEDGEERELTIDELLELLSDNYLFMPLYLYDHSGLSMSTSNAWPYNCPWDAGQVGWIYMSQRTALDEIGNCTVANWKERAAKILKGEVETYDNYLQGAVMGYNIYPINPDGSVDYFPIDSCWGYYGTEDNGILNQFEVLRDVNIEKTSRRVTTIRIKE